MHLTLGILRTSQAVFYALSFFWLDGFAVPAPAQVTQTVGTPLAQQKESSSHNFLFSIEFGKANSFFQQWFLPIMRKTLTIFLAVLPYVLMRIGWSGGGSIWLYWGSCIYASLALLLAGLIHLLYPHQTVAWFEPTSSIDEQKIKEYKTNGYSILVFCFLFSLFAIISYYKCPLIICVEPH